MDASTLVLVLLVGIIAIFVLSRCRDNRERYVDPIFLRPSLACEWHAKQNGSIYGRCANMYSGYPYYNAL